LKATLRLTVLIAAIGAIFAAAGLIAAVDGAEASAPGDCPNEERRLEQNATYLPDCRAYEMVSPVDKGGAEAVTPGATQLRSDPSGNVFMYTAGVAYADSTVGGSQGMYLATRTSAGWSLKGIQVPPVRGESSLLSGLMGLKDASVDLTTALYESKPPLVAANEDNAFDVYSRNEAGEMTWLSQGEFPRSTGVNAEYVASSADASHVVFSTEDHLLAADSPRTAGRSLYDRSGSDLNLVNVKPEGTASTCGAILGDGDYSFGGTIGAVSEDGSKIFFESPDPNGSGDPECGQPTRLYARVGATETVEVSAPEHSDPEGPQPVTFAGASRDGSKVFFITSEQLTADDPAHNPELYEYDLETEDLQRISGGVTGTASGDVVGLIRVSADGSHVYFMAHGELVPGKGTPGEFNIYCYCEGETNYVGTTFNIESLIGGKKVTEAGVSAHGEIFAYQSRPEGGDFYTPRQVWIYDAARDDVHCISCGAVRPWSEDFALDAGLRAITFVLGSQRQQQMVSDDGSRVFFSTGAPLVPRDTNIERDTYEWEAPGSGSCTEIDPAFKAEAAGCIYLLSSGKSDAQSFPVDASSDGSTVFIAAYDQFVGQDPDDLQDVYAVRVGGGQPVPLPPAHCGETDCRGQGEAGDNASHVGSLSFSGPGNLRTRRKSKGALWIKRVGPAARARAARTGRLDLVLRTQARGAITVTVTARTGGKPKTIAERRLRHPAVGLVHVHLRLAKTARRWLGRNGSLSLLIKARQAKVPGAKSARLVLRRAGGR
jgi:hypothetical protein